MSRRSFGRSGLVKVALAATLLAACGGETPSPTPGATSTTGTTTATPTSPSRSTSIPTSTFTEPPSPTPSTTTTAAGTLSGIPVYWVGHSRGEPALFREFRAVPDAGGQIASAVAAMTRTKPLDPDYSTPWRPASRVTVKQTGQSLAVDLSADAISATGLTQDVAEIAVHQLVYTATAAAYVARTPASTVTITIDGKSALAWGRVQLGAPTSRAPMSEVQAHAWVLSPQEGDVVKAGTVTFTGYGTSFEATFMWRITRADGGRVAEGSVMGGTGTGGFGELSWTAKLAAGTYIVRLATDDPSGGAPGSAGAAVDTKAFTVR